MIFFHWITAMCHVKRRMAVDSLSPVAPAYNCNVPRVRRSWERSHPFPYHYLLVVLLELHAYLVSVSTIITCPPPRCRRVNWSRCSNRVDPPLVRHSFGFVCFVPVAVVVAVVVVVVLPPEPQQPSAMRHWRGPIERRGHWSRLSRRRRWRRVSASSCRILSR